MLKRTLFLCVVSFLCASPSFGLSLYTSVDGSDSNPGTAAAPFQTIAFGAGKLKPGDTLFVRPGIYRESLYGKIPAGTSWNLPVTLKAYDPANRPILKPPAGGSEILKFGWYKNEYTIIDGFPIWCGAPRLSNHGGKGIGVQPRI